jgi:hypothetical protein
MSYYTIVFSGFPLNSTFFSAAGRLPGINSALFQRFPKPGPSLLPRRQGWDGRGVAMAAADPVAAAESRLLQSSSSCGGKVAAETLICWIFSQAARVNPISAKARRLSKCLLCNFLAPLIIPISRTGFLDYFFI